MSEDLQALLALAAKIPNPPSDSGAAQAQLDAACAEHIHEMLRDGGDPQEIIAYLGADLDKLAATPGTDPRAAQRVREALLARFQLQAHKNARRRRIIAAIPVVLLGLILAAYLTLKWVNLIGIHDPVDTRAGMIERATAVQKIVDYDSWKVNEIPSGRARFFVSVWTWPVEPTDSETAGARELVEEIRAVSQNLVDKDGQSPVYCGLWSDNNEVGLSLALSAISARIKDPATRWTGTPRETLRRIVHDYACPSLAAPGAPRR